MGGETWIEPKLMGDDINQFTDTRARAELGLLFVLDRVKPRSPLGEKRMRALKPYLPGAEPALEKEFDRLEAVIGLMLSRHEEISAMWGIIAMLKYVSAGLEREKKAAAEPFSVVELFEIKNFLLAQEALSVYCATFEGSLPCEFMLENTVALLDLMDPEKNRMATFYIYDNFSEKLAYLRGKRKGLEQEYRKKQKELKAKVEREHGINLNPKFEWTVPKSEAELVRLGDSIPSLMRVGEDYMSLTFALRQNSETDSIKKQIEDLKADIDDAEFEVRVMLTERILEYAPPMLRNMRRIAELDFTLAKAKFAIEYNCVRPKIVQPHTVMIINGRYLPLEEVLDGEPAVNSKRKPSERKYRPTSLSICSGITCITGANMGGKTISMKLAGQVAMMAQLGLFVPCESAEIGLSSGIKVLLGDSQDIQKGLSSFGSEVETLRDIMATSADRALIFIDEIAASTNPDEGAALTKGIVEYFAKKPWITMLTTHFDHVTSELGAEAGEPKTKAGKKGAKSEETAKAKNNIKTLRVRGLANADFKKLAAELQKAGAEKRVEVIAQHMDYSLEETISLSEVPKDALNIAYILGLEPEIIEEAKRFLS